LIRSVAVTRKKRRPTRPTRAARQKRLEQKTRRGKIKVTRGRVRGEE
jgi:ribosome-associated protein